MPRMSLRSALATGVACLIVPGALLAQTAVSGMSPAEPPPAFPSSSAPVPPNAPDMQEVLDAQEALGAQPLQTLTPQQARKQPTLTDAVQTVMKRKGLPTQPDPSVTTEDAAYGADPLEMVRIYKPARDPIGPRPLVVYYHGGGFVIADIRTYDATPRLLAKQLDAIVVSVEYRRAPEAKFPAQHEDAAMAYAWAVKKAVGWGADSKRVAVAGESAGGNLAVATAIYARDHKMQAPIHILAIYPIANASMTLPSKVGEANDKPLNTPMLRWFTHYWAGTPNDSNDPRINLVAADLRGLPPTTIINAANDPLRSDGETLAVALRSAGDSVEQRTFPGVTHEFFGAGQIVDGAVAAETYAVTRLKSALGSSD